MIAFHATFPTYGFPLLPPHPRGVTCAERNALNRRPVRLTGQQALSVANGFAEAAAVSGHHLLACAILPRQVQLVVELRGYPPEQVVGHLKRAAALRLKRDGRHPYQEECEAAGLMVSCWGPSRFAELQTASQVLATISAVESAPLRWGKPRQFWRFVQRCKQTRYGAARIA